MQDQASREPQHPQSRGGQSAVTALVGVAPSAVVRPIHFDDQPRLWREEIHDEGLHHDLASKPDAELRGAKRRPKQALGLGGRQPHAVRMSCELLLLAKRAE
jgi:hypothetical protein